MAVSSLAAVSAFAMRRFSRFSVLKTGHCESMRTAFSTIPMRFKKASGRWDTAKLSTFSSLGAYRVSQYWKVKTMGHCINYATSNVAHHERDGQISVDL